MDGGYYFMGFGRVRPTESSSQKRRICGHGKEISDEGAPYWSGRAPQILPDRVGKIFTNTGLAQIGRSLELIKIFDALEMNIGREDEDGTRRNRERIREMNS